MNLCKKKKEFADTTHLLIMEEMKNLKINFKFYPPSTPNGIWTWTALMGPDKLKMLKSFPVAYFFNQSQSQHGQQIQYLWRKFYELYMTMRQQELTDQDIDIFEQNAKDWVRAFCRPTVGVINDANQQPGMYSRKEVTPYMHVFAYHVPQFMRYLKQKKLSLRLFSTCSLEKKNHNHVSPNL